jgi:proteasome lid subunit RPN8/RPN11
MMAKPKKDKYTTLHISAEVAREIRQHARSNSKTEVCGVLVGTESDGITSIEACISGVNAAQAGTHVTFTQDTWEHIYKIKDRDFPNERIVGWYHSHPGFGVFLSDHDTFIHKNFFSSPQQVAWVYDPHSDEEGCFGWKGERLERLTQFAIVDGKGGELAGATGKPEPSIRRNGDMEEGWDEVEKPRVTGKETKGSKDSKDEKDQELSNLANIVSVVFSHLAVLIIGGLLVWYFLPHVVVMGVPVDPYTHQPLEHFRDLPPDKSAPPAPQQPDPNHKPNAPESSKPDSSGSRGPSVQ